MKIDDFRFVHRLRVRWAEVDLQKIVFNAHYLMYLDTAVADYWRALALPYEEAMQALGGDIFVKKSTLEFHASAEYEDFLDIGLKCAHIGNSSMRFEGAIFRGNELLISAELVYVFADPVAKTSLPVPPALRALLLAYEAGEPVVQVKLGPWSELQADAGALRVAVFVQEQRIPIDQEWDAADAGATHAVAYNRMGVPVATARLLRDAEGHTRIGRMAVHRVLRGGGYGAQVLEALAARAREQGAADIRLHAQQSAVGFYTRLGFVPCGPVFEEVGIPHMEMMRSTAP